MWFSADSPWYRPLSEPPPGPVDVGDGKTSARREDASFRSLFQMVPPQGKEALLPAGPRARAPVEAEREPQAPVSAEGVVGCEAVGDMEALAKELFLTRLLGG